MPRDWEDTFRFWGRPPSETERTKCENAERAIRKAINADETLSKLTLSVFPQGSYRNRTNVLLDSDVDICICCKGVIVPGYPDQATTLSDVGLIPATYTYQQFKNDVGMALISYFGSQSVTRGTKAFDIHENTYRIDADVVATFEHRRYTYRGLGGQWLYLTGTAFFPDNGGEVNNWPEQQYTNGVRKNDATGKRYKAMARIFKTLRNEMDDDGIAAAKPMASFLLECLAYNVPNNLLIAADYKTALEASISHIYHATTSFNECGEWTEVNELKYLFRGPQPWTFQQVNQFALAVWNHVGFGS